MKRPAAGKTPKAAHRTQHICVRVTLPGRPGGRGCESGQGARNPGTAPLLIPKLHSPRGAERRNPPLRRWAAPPPPPATAPGRPAGARDPGATGRGRGAPSASARPSPSRQQPLGHPRPRPTGPQPPRAPAPPAPPVLSGRPAANAETRRQGREARSSARRPSPVAGRGASRCAALRPGPAPPACRLRARRAGPHAGSARAQCRRPGRAQASAPAPRTRRGWGGGVEARSARLLPAPPRAPSPRKVEPPG